MIGLLAGVAARSLGASRLAAFNVGRGVSAAVSDKQPSTSNISESPTVGDLTADITSPVQVNR